MEEELVGQIFETMMKQGPWVYAFGFSSLG